MKNDEIKLFIKDEPTLKERFLIFMNLLVTNQSESRVECILFFAFFYLQTISGFFTDRVKLLNPKENISDNILFCLEKIIRFKDTIKGNKNDFELFIYIWAIILILFTLIFIFILYQTNRDSLYTAKYYFINILIKISYYILYNIILDFFSTFLCFGAEKSDIVKDYSCSISDHIGIFLVSFISTLYCIFMVIFLQTYYIDCFYLSVNYYSQIATKYNILMALNAVCFSITKSLINHLTTEVFLVLNIFISIYLFYFYYRNIIFYDEMTNKICGIFHIVYIWTPIFFFITKYLDISELGLLWFLASLIVTFIYFNLKNKFEDWIFCQLPYYKIQNINYLLFYLRSIITMINTGLENQKIKTRLTGIIQIHILECPNPKCLTKTKQKLYLPSKNEWSDRSKPFITDFVFLNSLIVAIMNYFIASNFYSPELLINFSYYYLEVIGNISLSIYFLHKVELMKMTAQELFTLERLKIMISQKLIEKLKKKNEYCSNLEDLNTTFFYKYDFNKRKFYEEINKDLELTEDFWKIFSKKENKSIIDFNNVFKISEQIMISKSNVEKIWKILYSLYSGINEVFDFYSDYVEQINDDSFLKRELESIKRKNETSSDSINQNYYNLMFKSETGICICNGDNGKEGLIEKVNLEFEKIFKFTNNELIGKDISILMPKIFSNQHKEFMQNYINIGEKIIIDTKEYFSFAKDKNNSIIFIRLYVKLFPVLNNSVFFIGMILPEKIDDLIFIDSNFIIQGMSKKIQERLKLKNKMFFNDNDIPFYMICKNFVNFYKIFMKGNKQQISDDNNNNEQSDSIILSQTIIYDKDELCIEDEEKENQENNIEINENIELEYEIKIPNFMMEFQKNAKRDLIAKNIAPETMIVEKSNLIDNTRININFHYDEEEILLIPKEEKSYYEKMSDKSNLSQKSFKNNNDNNKINNNNNNDNNKNKKNNNNNNENKNNNEDNKKNNNKDNKNNNNNNKNNNNNNNNYNIVINKDLTPDYSGKNNITPNGITPTPKDIKNKLSIKSRKSNQSNAKVKFHSSLSNNSTSPEGIFNQKLNLYKKLFNYNKFTDLEEIIENDTRDYNTLSYKFNFTFKKYNYRKDKLCYVIRCVDNKSELGLNKLDDDSQNNEAGKKIISQQNKLSSLKKCYDIKAEEKERIIENINNFGEYFNDNEDFQNILFKNKEHIKKYSRVHGSQKQNTVMDDENASQSSAPGFNSDLSKLNRIFEIRENILKNNKSLNSLYYMLFTALSFVFGAGIFSSVFFIIYKKIDKDLNKLDELQSNYYIVQNDLLQIISSSISLIALTLSLYEEDYKISYNSYISDKEEYFNYLFESSIKWIDDSTSKLNLVERFFCEFGGANYFWGRINTTYPFIYFEDKEPFPMTLTRSLIDSSVLLHNLNLSRNISNYNQDEKDKLYFLIFEAIYNSYDYVIPLLLNSNIRLLDYIKNKNNKKINSVWYLNGIYLFFVCLCFIIYLWQLMITNNFMGEGLEKLVKISQEKVNEMIEKIKGFKEVLKIQIENENNNGIVEDNKSESIEESSSKTLSKKSNESENTNIQKISSQQSTPIKRQETNDFNLDFKKNKKLNLQNTSYVHLALIFIVCTSACLGLFLISKRSINDNIKIMEVQTYLYGRFASSSCQMVKLKCTLLKCNVNNTLDCTSFMKIKDLSHSYYSSLSNYPLLRNFYNNYFLIDACGALFNLESEDYNTCLKNPLVNNINNTDTFIDMLNNKINNILYEHEAYMKYDVYFKSFYLFSSSFFSLVENIHYVFVIPVIERLDDVILQSVNEELRNNKNIALYIISFLIIAMVIFIIYVKFFFLTKLDYFLNISKCIVKIIPSTMISTNPDLENWLERMNNRK